MLISLVLWPWHLHVAISAHGGHILLLTLEASFSACQLSNAKQVISYQDIFYVRLCICDQDWRLYKSHGNWSDNVFQIWYRTHCIIQEMVLRMCRSSDCPCTHPHILDFSLQTMALEGLQAVSPVLAAMLQGLAAAVVTYCTDVLT